MELAPPSLFVRINMKVIDLLSNPQPGSWPFSSAMRKVYEGDFSELSDKGGKLTIRFKIRGWKTDRKWDIEIDRQALIAHLLYIKREMMQSDDLDLVIKAIKDHNDKLVELEKKVIHTKAVNNQDAGKLVMELLREKIPADFKVTDNGASYIFTPTHEWSTIHRQWGHINVRIESNGPDLMVHVDTPICNLRLKVEMANPAFNPDEFPAIFYKLIYDALAEITKTADSIKEIYASGFMKEVNT